MPRRNQAKRTEQYPQHPFFYQDRAGNIRLGQVSASTILTRKQVGEMGIDCYSLPDYAHELHIAATAKAEQCEWVKTVAWAYFWETGCSKAYQSGGGNHDFKHCPYCGKEIVGGDAK